MPVFVGSPDRTAISTPGINGSHFDVMGLTIMGPLALCALAITQAATIIKTAIHFFIRFSF
jgi:hypothetical protein